MSLHTFAWIEFGINSYLVAHALLPDCGMVQGVAKEKIQLLGGVCGTCMCMHAHRGQRSYLSVPLYFLETWFLTESGVHGLSTIGHLSLSPQLLLFMWVQGI